MEEKGLDVDDVETVNARVHPLVVELTSKRSPKDGLEGKFSVFHGCAIGLLYGKAGPAQYADEVVTSDEVVRLRDKCDAEADRSLRADEVVIEVTLKNGKRLEKHVEHAIGSLEVPMTDEQLEDKFVDQCLPVLGDRTRQISKLCWSVGHAPDVAKILQQL